MGYKIDATEFSGKRALVTGGTQGIGEPVVKRLAGAGARVITTARSIPTEPHSTDALFVQADISTSEGCEKVIRETLTRLGGIDIIVNVVGGSSSPSGGFGVLTDKEWQNDLNVNPAFLRSNGLKQQKGDKVCLSNSLR